MVAAITSSSRAGRLSPHALVIGLLLLALAPAARADLINNLQQIGVGAHNAGNDLSQLGLGLHNGSYVAADGSVRTVVGDGSVRSVSIGTNASAVLCLHNVTTTGDIRDGTSNTLLFSESIGLQFTGGTLLGSVPIRGIADGTSNTITFPESPLHDFCVDDVTNIDPVAGAGITDGTSNTIRFGENSYLDLCFNRALLPSITDGTSNTILLPETRNSVCFNNVVASPDLTIVSTVPTVAEPATLALAFVPLVLALTWHRRGRAGARRA
jgi:hypothetical protein